MACLWVHCRVLVGLLLSRALSGLVLYRALAARFH
jgi:hypothetical protein